MNTYTTACTTWNCKYHVVFVMKYRGKWGGRMFRNRSDFKSYVSGKVKYFRNRSLSGSYSYVIGDTVRIFRKPGQGTLKGKSRCRYMSGKESARYKI